ncbi:TRIC cation channel family protein, partial [Dialister invisus]
MSLTWTVFEILGTVAFAFSGATVGLARGMDVFGIALLSVVTAVGGGILRDVLAG